MRSTFRIAALTAAVLLYGLIASAQDTITVKCFEDYYLADANFSLTIDGASVTTSTPCTARSTSPGVAPATVQTSTFTGSWGGTAKAHTIVVKFLNDQYGGSSATDRNLYVQSVAFDGAPTTVGSFVGMAKILGTAGAALVTTNDSATFTSAAVTPATPPNPPTVQFVTINLSASLGFGSAAPPAPTHSVALTWQASTSSGITGYNVYRSTVSGGSYAKVGTTAALTYTDATVSSGQTYFYVTTALAGTAESGYSNQASATIP